MPRIFDDIYIYKEYKEYFIEYFKLIIPTIGSLFLDKNYRMFRVEHYSEFNMTLYIDVVNIKTFKEKSICMLDFYDKLTATEWDITDKRIRY